MVSPTAMAYLRDLIQKARVPLVLCLGNRLVLFFVTFLGLVIRPMDSEGRPFPTNLFLDGWINWDSGWYLRIAEHGYTVIPGQLQQATNFFPLYPLTIRLLNNIVDDYLISGLIVSNVTFPIACVMLHRLLVRLYDETIATRSLMLLLAYPFAFYFSTIYTESLFLMGVVGAFYFSQRNRWALASICGAIAGGTRVVGIFVMLPVFLTYMQRKHWKISLIRPDIFLLALGLLGLGGYMTFLYVEFNDPLWFTRTQWVPGWGDRCTSETFAILWRRTLDMERFLSGSFDSVLVMSVVLGGLTLVLCLIGFRQLPLGATLWALISIGISMRLWSAAGRYSAVIWPAFVVMALMMRRRENLYQNVLVGSYLLQGLYAFLFAHGEFMG
jgi:Mannosyltransferase (PIG-V)